jgi:hypothetical protein
MSDTTATLIIDRSSSVCSACGRGAKADETSHDSILGWSGQKPGCGATYTATASHYMGEQMADGIRAMRPDLPFVGVWSHGEVSA